MTKTQDESKQLQFRLLADVSCPTSSTSAPQEKQLAFASSVVSVSLQASETDMSVYRQISGNYFRSLRKVTASS